MNNGYDISQVGQAEATNDKPTLAERYVTFLSRVSELLRDGFFKTAEELGLVHQEEGLVSTLSKENSTVH